MFIQSSYDRIRTYRLLSKVGLLVAVLTPLLGVLPGAPYFASPWFIPQVAAGLMLYTSGLAWPIIIDETYCVKRWHWSVWVCALFHMMVFIVFVIKSTMALVRTLTVATADLGVAVFAVLFCVVAIVVTISCYRELWHAIQLYRATR